MNAKLLLSITSIVAVFFFSKDTAAQMVGGNIFLKGAYVEAGIAGDGHFGAPTPPAGYHPHLTTAGGGASLGFVADPAMDGWSVGTPAYVGDYFVPGCPWEGWGLQIDTTKTYANACSGAITGTTFSGANTGYTTTGSKIIATWEGVLDSVTIRQVTTLDTNDLFFSMRVTLINTASVPKNNIYYFRSVDPDNDISWPGGNFATRNKIQYQQPNPLGASVVSATGLTGLITRMSLGTLDTNGRCLILSSALGFSPGTDLATVYGLTYPSLHATGDSNLSDIGIAIAFRVAHLAPVDSASDSVGYKTTGTVHLHPANEKSFTYFYAFGPSGTDSAIAHLIDTATIIVPPPTVVNNINAGAEIKVYPNPAGSMVNVAGLEVTHKLQLIDMMGKEINSGWLIEAKQVNSFSLDLVPAGNYVILVKDEQGRTLRHVPLRKQ